MDAPGSWDPMSPEQLGELFNGFAQPWWIAGGWALDLFLGRQTRPHEDIDVEIPRKAQASLATLLAGWDLQLASSGKLTPWDSTAPIPEDVNGLWCRPRREGPWRLQVMLAPTAGDIWIYRRDDRISRALDDIVRVSPNGLPYLAPEIQLLFKARTPRPKDEQDLGNVLGKLDEHQRDWLATSLDITVPGHPWIEIVRAE